MIQVYEVKKSAFIHALVILHLEPDCSNSFFRSKYVYAFASYDSICFYLGALSRLDVCILLLFLFDCNGFDSLSLHSLLHIGLDTLLRFHMLLFYASLHLTQLTWTGRLRIHVRRTLIFLLLLLLVLYVL